MKRFGVFLVAAATYVAAPAHAAVTSLTAESNAAYLADYAKQPGVIKKTSGLMYKILHNGFGKRPGLNDDCTVSYTGSLINGTVFDGTEEGLPTRLKPKAVIPGWTEALMNMREGDQWHIVIPPNLAYGARGAGDGAIPPNQTLVFDVTLIAVTPFKEPPKDQQPDTAGNGAE